MLTVAAVLCLVASAPPPAPEFTVGVPYATRTGTDGQAFEIKLNLARPAGMKKGDRKPCVVAIHGGGWTAGKREDLDGLVKILADQGWVAATVSYRFAPTPGVQDPKTARFPAQVEDCAAAVRFLKEHAEEYGIDPERVGAVGFSAGAHLAMMLAVADGKDGVGMEALRDGAPSGRVGAAVSFVGPTDLLAKDIPRESLGIISNLIGAEADLGGKSRDERARAASPVAYVTKDDAPILMFFGTKDPLVPHTQAYGMLDAMTAAGVAGRAELIAGAGHGFGGAEGQRTMAATTAFFTEHLKAK